VCPRFSLTTKICIPTPLLGKEGQGVVVSLVQQIFHCEQLQSRKLLKAREVSITGNQRYAVVKTTLGDQCVRYLGAIAMAD